MATLPGFIKKLFLFPVLIVVLIVLASLIDPMKTITDVPRISMNCPNSIGFNITAWNLQSDYVHTIYSTGCYALNWDVLAFIGLLTGIAIWGWLSK